MSTPRQGEQEKKGTFETIAAEASAHLSGLFGPSVPEATVAGDALPGAGTLCSRVLFQTVVRLQPTCFTVLRRRQVPSLRSK